MIWDEGGLPRSRLFDDVYFSASDGLAESRAVFLSGCGLPEAWRGRSRFTVAELGFGSGLNILALLDLWRRAREPGARLHIFSVEAHPMPAPDAARVLGAWPELADLAAPLIARWPGRARGFHRVAFPRSDAILDLAVMDAGEALDAWDGAADAWFLDGFSPSANPGMWSEALMAAVARHCAPGARAATFTVAGGVRRALAAAGFTVEKRPGFGRKRERLEAVWPGQAEPGSACPPRVAIIGAGIAGAALARAFRVLGAEPLVIEHDAPGSGASGNAAALVMPRLDAGGGAVAQLYAQAFARATGLYAETAGVVIARGAVQIEVGPKDPDRFDRIAASDLFEPGSVERLRPPDPRSPPGAAGGLAFAGAQVIDPAALLTTWLAPSPIIQAQVADMAWDDGAWRLAAAGGAEIARARIVCLAGGLAARAFAPDAPLSPVRGQVSVFAGAERPAAMIGGGYLIPTRDGLLFGATHDRDQTDTVIRAEDHARNLAAIAALQPDLAQALAGQALDGRAGVRAATPDFLPLAGAVPGRPGLFILSGLGSRGFCAAPLLAEHVAAQALGAPSPLPRALAEIVDPERFDKRRARIGRPRG